jgi:aspartate/methionine/tyrosine aminotransferase
MRSEASWPDLDEAADQQRSILGNDTHYTAMDGSPGLKDAIALKFARDNGLTFTRSEIVVSASAKMMIFMALFATVEPGDEIIIPAPYWGSYIDIAQILGATPVVVATRPEDGFRLRAADLEAAITPRTRWLLINSPSNPSGAVYEHEHYAPFLDVVARHPQVWLIADDIFEHLVYDGVQFVTPLQVRPCRTCRTPSRTTADSTPSGARSSSASSTPSRALTASPQEARSTPSRAGNRSSATAPQPASPWKPTSSSAGTCCTTSASR